VCVCVYIYIGGVHSSVDDAAGGQAHVLKSSHKQNTHTHTHTGRHTFLEVRSLVKLRKIFTRALTFQIFFSSQAHASVPRSCQKVPHLP
jgi:hypothetical protein